MGIKFALALIGISTASASIFFASYNYRAKLSYELPNDFLSSETNELINPLGNKMNSDTYHIELKTDKSNEEILARFTRGFFGGITLTLERSLSKMILKNRGQTCAFTGNMYIDTRPFESILDSKLFFIFPVDKSKPTIWDPQDIPTTVLLPLNIILYGLFQLIYYEMESNCGTLDFAFGSDLTRFSGVQRLQVLRLTEKEVIISLTCIRGNPSNDKTTIMDYLNSFHLFYAKLLFNDAIKEIIKP